MGQYHKISVTFANRKLRNFSIAKHIRHCIQAALREQNVDVPCEINVLVTNDRGIQGINKTLRNLDKPTDVLSFPMFQFQPGQLPEDWEPYIDPESQLVPLGDMAISLERAKAQAKEYGHSVNREVGYLTVHSVLHLLGYDHLDEGPMKRQMRSREEAILAEILLPR